MEVDDDVVIAAIRAVHAAGGAPLSNQQLVEFISKPVNMGRPVTPPYKGRGRRPTKTQYDRAFERRKGLYQRLVRLPALRSNMGDVPHLMIVAIGQQLRPATPKRALSRRVEEVLARKGVQPPHRDNIRRHLKRAGLLD